MVHPATIADPALKGNVVDTKKPEASQEISATPRFDQFIRDHKAEGGDIALDPYDAILKQVLSAESPDAVLTPTETAQGSDLLDVPLLLMGFHLNESEFDAGSPFYATLEVVDMRTEQGLVVNTGHKKVLAQLVRLQQLSDGPNETFNFPYQVMFITRGQSKVGTPMLELRKWEAEDEKKEAPF
jgi:hypothetical protein